MVYDHEITEDFEMYTVTKNKIGIMEGEEVEPIRSKRGDSTIIIY